MIVHLPDKVVKFHHLNSDLYGINLKDKYEKPDSRKILGNTVEENMKYLTPRRQDEKILARKT